MFTVVDQIANPENISATDVAYGDSSVAEAIAKKQDAETGKGLSTNDYTNDEKAKLAALPTNTALQSALDGKQAAGNYVLNGNGSYASFDNRAFFYSLKQSEKNIGVGFFGMDTADADGVVNQLLVFNRASKTIAHQTYNSTTNKWSTEATYSADEDTGWQTLETGVNYRKKNGVVYLDINKGGETPLAGGDVWRNLSETALPTGYRPAHQIFFAGYCAASGGNPANADIMFLIGTDGIIKYFGWNATGGTATAIAPRGSVSFPV